MSEEISLYRKYRPQNFAHLVGQDHIRTTLINALKNQRLGHAYLFCGPRGTGKTTTARLIAKAINCLDLSKDDDPCNKCDICEEINAGRLIDLIEIDAASNRGIDEIRDLREKIKFAPTRAKKKVYIIDEVHMLTKEAFNALLKTLEEPPDHASFILATTEAHKVPATIISRCQRFDFKRIDKKAVMTRLQFIAQSEKIEVEEETLELIAQSVQGSLRDAIGLLEQAASAGKLTYQSLKENLGVSGPRVIEEFFNLVINQESQKALNKITEIYHEGADLVQFNREFLEYLRDKLLAAVAGKREALVRELLYVITHFQKAGEELKSTIIPQLPLEMAVVKTSLVELSTEKGEVKAEEVKETKSSDKKAEPKVAEYQPEKKPTGLKKSPAVSPPAEEEIGEPLKIKFSFRAVKDNWARILDHITTPSVRRSLQAGQISKLEKNELTLVFSSDFHLDTVKTAKNIAELEGALEEIFGGKIKVMLELTKVKLEPDQKEEVTKSPIKEPEDELVDKALEVFGGELVEND